MPRELDSCVRQVKKKGNVDNAWAVCRAKLGSDEDIKRRRSKKTKKNKGLLSSTKRD